MAITALPSTTVRLLNSAQVLTSPVSLVKELIDNALDAKATSIDILISPNTLDKVEVRDNGHGIPAEDLDALARHGHTSKLRSFEDLKRLGGLTLGFRGEALASAVELGDVMVTTKTEGESVGTMVKLKATGGIGNQTRTSHPVGTTVSVKHFMAKLPVRKTTFEKEAAKSIAKITRLLQGYALARPSTRLSLKVSNGGKGSWSFIPHPSGDIREAVLRAIGRDTALQCDDIVMPCREEKNTMDTAPKLLTIHATGLEHFTIDAFLPVPHADPSKIGSGQFMSVDSRPVSHEKGTMKKIVTIFKKYLRGSLNDADNKLKSPFIRLNINCPVASYDANVEPTKDEVLFGNEDLLLETVERLFWDVYGECRTPSTTSALRLSANSRGNIESPIFQQSHTSFDVDQQHCGLAASTEMQARMTRSASDHAGAPNCDQLVVVEPAYIDQMHRNKPTKWGVDMSEDLSIGVEGNDERHNIYSHDRASPAHTINQMQQSQEPRLNPWTIAKKTPGHFKELATATGNMNPFPVLIPTEPEIQIVSPHEAELLILPQSTTPPRQPSTSCYHRPQSSDRQQLPFEPESDLSITDSEHPHHSARKNDFVTARSIVQDSLISPPPTQLSEPSSRARVLKPFIPPVRDTPNRVVSDGLRQTTLLPVREPSTASIDNQQEVSGNPDLVWAMDFEKRKEEATRRRREEYRAPRAAGNGPATSKSSRSSPHKNRYNAAVANLEVSQRASDSSTQEQDEKPFQTSLSEDDPRAYFMRRRRSTNNEFKALGGPPKLMRMRSTRLPLETVPREAQLQQLIQSLPIEFDGLYQATLILTRYNVSIDKFAGLAIEPEDISVLTQKLQAIVTSEIKNSGDGEVEIEYTLDKAVQDLLIMG